MLEEMMALSWECNSINEIIDKTHDLGYTKSEAQNMWKYSEQIIDFYENDYRGDALFFSGKIHGCEDEVYILYLNLDSHIPSWEIEIIDYDQILKAYELSTGDEGLFWDALPDVCQGCWEWCYVDPDDEYDYFYSYKDADEYIGWNSKSMDLLVNWARERKQNDR